MRISDWSSDVCSSDLAPSGKRSPDSRDALRIVQPRRRSSECALDLAGQQRHEADPAQVLFAHRRPATFNQLQRLTAGRSDRNHQTTAGGELLDQRRRYALGARGDQNTRSEEHTSELQSLMRISYAVFCLKKKNITEP